MGRNPPDWVREDGGVAGVVARMKMDHRRGEESIMVHKAGKRDETALYSLRDTTHSSNSFNAVSFDRKEIDRWLRANGLSSKYIFVKEPTATAEKITAAIASDRWPWGNHHTEALGHLEAAASKFWKLYDPNEPGTAPINEQVVNWLVNERNVSKKMAIGIASMLRPRNLKTGPRKL